jgi:MFS family permease
MLPMAAVSFLPLAVTAFNPGTQVAFVLWTLAGIGASFVVVVYPLYMTALPDEFRGRTYGLLATTIMSVQGAGLLLGGAFGQVFSVPGTIAVSGLLGLVGLAALRATWPHADVVNVAFRGSRSSADVTTLIERPQKATT